MGDFLQEKKHILQWKILHYGRLEPGVENVRTKVPKGTPLRQIWSNKSFGVCASSETACTINGKRQSLQYYIQMTCDPTTIQPRATRPCPGHHRRLLFQ